MSVLKKSITDFDSWQGKLSLGFTKQDDRTTLTEHIHQGPLLVQRPFYPEGPVCHVYLIHPPGGVVGGDELSIDVNCHEDSKVLITTPAAGKFYKSNGKTAYQNVNLHVAKEAVLEWMPQETILFDDANVISSTQIDLRQNARFFGWEIIGLGRPFCNESFTHGVAEIKIAIALENKPLLTERIALNEQTITAMSGLAGHSLLATLLMYPAGPEELEKAREIAGSLRYFGATLINNLLVCRFLGDQAEPAKKLFVRIWQALRPGLNKRPACLPRIWAT